MNKEFEKVYTLTEGQLNDLLHDVIELFMEALARNPRAEDIRGAIAQGAECEAVTGVWEKIDPSLHGDEELSMN